MTARLTLFRVLATVVFVAAHAVVGAPTAARGDIELSVPLFGGGIGGSNPTPPIGLLPVPPTLDQSGPNGRFVLQLVTPTPRLVVLRSLDGRLLDVVSMDGSLRFAMAVPAEGALLDVLGTDALGVPVGPGMTLTVVSD